MKSNVVWEARKMKPCVILIFFMLIYTAVALKCVIQEKKSQEEPEIQIIHLDEESKDSSEPEILSFQIPDKRKREVWDSKSRKFCKTDEDCLPGEKCIAYLRCVRATKRPPENKELDQQAKL